MVSKIKVSATGVLICGGASIRFGQDKRQLSINGKTFMDLGLEKLFAICKEVIVAPRTKDNMPKCNLSSRKFKIVEDEKGMEGPIAGIIAALNEARYEDVLVLGCDFPLVSLEFLQYIFYTASFHPDKIIVPKIENVLQPFVALYRKSISEMLELWIAKEGNYSMKNFLEYNPHCVYMVDKYSNGDLSKELFNVNTVSDYHILVRKYLI